MKTQATWPFTEGIRKTAFHEILEYQLRRNNVDDEFERQYAFMHSEDYAKVLAARGLNQYTLPFYKGFGWKAEERGRRMAVQAVPVFKKHGIHPGAYIRVTTVGYESWIAEEPEAERWGGLTVGKRIPRYSSQYFRYRGCMCQDGYIAFHERTSAAAAEAGFDLIHFDGTAWNDPATLCACDACQEKFRAFVMGRYPTEEALRGRFGLPVMDGLTIPDLTTAPYYSIGDIVEIQDPLLQEFVLFRCQALSDFVKAVAESARRVNPEIVIMINAKYMPGPNTAWITGTDEAALAEHVDVMFSEENGDTELRDDGSIVSRVRTYKVAQALKTIVFATQDQGHADTPAKSERTLCQDMALNRGCLGLYMRQGDADIAYGEATPEEVDARPLNAAQTRVFRYHKRHIERLAGGETFKYAGVWRSFLTHAFNSREPHLADILATQSLWQENIPWSYLYPDVEQSLDRYAVIVLPETEILTPEEFDRLDVYVRGGGGVTLIGPCGTRDAFRRLTRKPLIRERWGVTCSRDAPWRTVAVGDGRVAFVPALRTDVGIAEGPAYFPHYTKENFRRPTNDSTFLRAVLWAAGKPLPLRLVAPQNVIAEIVEFEDKGRTAVHLVNYALDKPAEGVRLWIDPSLNAAATEADVFTLDREEPAKAPIRMAEGRRELVLSRLDRWAMVVLENG